MKKILFTILSMATLPLMAQTTVTFDSEDYSEIGVYDTWEKSPFRTGVLAGNAKVIDNHLMTTSGSLKNKTAKIVGVQRSRFGSNTFGVKVTLPSAFATSETTQYVHVMVCKPNTSKVMLVGLGKRESFTDEPTTVEQFWVKASKDYTTANQWQDMVFPVKTVSGVKIYSLVVVPDLQSPHAYTEDFACYIDQIEVNSSSTPRTGTYGDGNSTTDPDDVLKEDYYVNFDKTQTNTRESSSATNGQRYLKGVSLKGTDGTSYTYTASESDAEYHLVYKDMTKTQVWDVKAGNTYTPAIDYQGNWMQGYAYVDYNQDGQFTVKMSGNYRDDSSEAVAYSGYNATAETPLYSSTGTAVSGESRNSWVMPSFTIPSTTKAGIYRMRFKIDWNCIEPGGGDGSDNVNMQSIINNGGGIVDVLLNVHDDNVTVTGQWRNGDLTTTGGTTLQNYSTPFKKALGIVAKPHGGFDFGSIDVKHGYNFGGEQYVHGNRQWQTMTYAADDFGGDGTFTLPAEIFDGNVYIDGNFKEKTYIELSEDEKLPEFSDGTANVCLTRSFAAGKYSTIVLPFALTQAQISAAFGETAKAYSFQSDKTDVIYFKSMADDETAAANVPFLIVIGTEGSSFTFDDVALVYGKNPVTTGTYYDFVGNYDGEVTIDEGQWIISNNKFYRSIGKSKLKGYRGYFKPHTGNEAKALTFVIDDEATGITTVFSSETTNETYNLQGQRVNGKQLRRGVYITDGKKKVVK